MKKIIVCTNETLRKGESFFIDLDISIPEMNLNEHEAIVLTPVLTKGNHSQELPHVLINGEMRHKGYRQMVKHLGKDVFSSTYNIYRAFKVRRSRDRVCYYNIRIDYESWMNGAVIEMRNVDRI